MSSQNLNIPSRQEEESRIAASWLHRLQSILAERDRSLFSAALNAASIRPQDFEQGSKIRLEQLDAAQLFVRERYPDITLRMYDASDLLDLGLIGYAMASSGTLRRAWEIAIKYHDLTSDRYQLELIETGASVVVRQIHFLGHLTEYVDMGEELAGIQKILKSLVGSQANMSETTAHFNYPPTDYVETYNQIFDGKCHFNAEHTELHFPSSWLDIPVTTANASTSAVCASMCERVLSAGQLVSSTTEAVQRLLVSRAGREIPSLESAAEQLNLSVNQLRKRLYRDNTSYKKVVLDVRMTLARHYLEATSLSIQEIAYLLDYSQPAPFSRAFKTYFGYPPLMCRQAK